MATQGKRLLTFEEVREVPCPVCEAVKGEACRRAGFTARGRVRHTREIHPDRYRAAARRRDKDAQR